MKRILLGTTNPSKVNRFKELLKGYDLSFCTLKDIKAEIGSEIPEPDETGSTPEENAALKAKFYSRYNDIVLCNDSGLYFSSLEINDKRQPALNIRSPFGKRLDDNEMIEYYSSLVRSLGGNAEAYYLDGFAVYNKEKSNEKLSTFMNIDYSKESSFYMVDVPSEKRRKGWPLDSISKNRYDGKYFTDYEKNFEMIIVDKYENMLREFLKKAFGIENR